MSPSSSSSESPMLAFSWFASTSQSAEPWTGNAGMLRNGTRGRAELGCDGDGGGRGGRCRGIGGVRVMMVGVSRGAPTRLRKAGGRFESVGRRGEIEIDDGLDC